MKDIKTKKNLKRILLPSFFIIGITAITSNGISSLNQSLAMVQTGSPAIHGNNNSSKMIKEKIIKDKITSLTALIIKSNSKAEEAKNSGKKALLGEAITLNELADELDKEAVKKYETADELADELDKEAVETYERAEEFRKITDELVDLFGEEEAYKFLDAEAADIVLDEAYKAEDKLRKVAVELRKASELKLLHEAYKTKYKVASDLYEAYKAAYKPQEYEAAHKAASKAYQEYKAAYEAYTAAADITDENRIPKKTLHEMLTKLTKLTADLYTKRKLAITAEAATKEVIEVLKVSKEKLKAADDVRKAKDDVRKAKDDVRKAADEARKTLDEMRKTEDEVRKEENKAKTELNRYKYKENDVQKKSKKKILSPAEKKLAKAQEELNIKTYKEEELTPLIIKLDAAQDEADYEITIADDQAADSEKAAIIAEKATPETEEDTEKLRLKLEKKHKARIFENQKLT